MIRVLVAEDSRTVRELLVEILESDPGIEVVGQAANGAEAVDLAKSLRPDLITMDIHMPVLDGFEATKEIMTLVPTPILIVSSQTAHRDVEHSLNATRAGALMVLRTPDNPASEHFEKLRKEFMTMVKAMAGVKVVRQWKPRARLAAVKRPDGGETGRRLVAIAASTGGPAALQQILMHLPRGFETPIVIVQHIAEGFVAGLAEWLGSSCDLHVKIAQDNEPLRPRTVYLPPDRIHLGISHSGRIALANTSPIGGFIPSATHLFRSAAASYGSRLTAVILTGMGRDGVDGLREVRAAGGRTIAQDERTSIVFGMPNEAIKAGLVDEVLPVEAIAARLTVLLDGDANE